MPPKQWIDKKSATTYQLVHRSQNDPLIHDRDAQDRFLFPVSGPSGGDSSSSQVGSGKTLGELEKELALKNIRANEGEAANYGIYYDDSGYDYMKHLRELGSGGGGAYFVEAKTKGKDKQKVKLEDALRGVSLEDKEDMSEFGGSSVYGSEMGGSMYSYGGSTTASYARKPTYQDQQNIPDAIAGFKPNMDPRLREALEALEDDEFVDADDEEDIFGTLIDGAHGEEMDATDWESNYIEEEDDGWESDVTEKAPVQKNHTDAKAEHANVSEPATTAKSSKEDEQIPDIAPDDGDWMKEFAKFKKDMKAKPAAAAAPAEGTPSEFKTATSVAFTAGGTPIRKKKRKGAMTNPSAYSMTSSSLSRTEGLRLLDDRFERVEALYALDEEGEEEFDGSSIADDRSMVSGMTGYSQAPSLISATGDVPLRSDFHNVMDDFLSGWDDHRGPAAKRKGAKGKRGKNGNEVIGIKMLDEVRQGLGPARMQKNVSGKV